ncbi:MAG: hypothetical protein JO154_25915 [Chitinophaga sp.]|uniref:hypothetical protein n=1 Tax=Chitinophaga sp. TaxID=1869181 RepID=UPI0025C49836|nr:hypothetical protein [Chitinophaga sp.]MBV8256059.1 hypothetical protein [Chitinophaga sp.]
MKNLLSYLPLLFITCLMSYSIYVVLTTNIIFSYEHYIGLTVILIALISMPFSRLINRISTLSVLVLGSFSQAAFTPIISRTRLGLAIGHFSIEIVIQRYCIILLILFIILNWGWIKGWKQRAA